ncbi:hypothetical protein AB5I41_05525 [Sphingomonas sp. MMS24-JH45]
MRTPPVSRLARGAAQGVPAIVGAARRGGGGLPDGVLDQLVSAIVVEDEEIGPNRYIARLGVLFDRDRASSILGVSAAIDRSPPMVVIPIVWSTGVGTGFEQRTAWQEAWARYRTGQSEVDDIRPAGTVPIRCC